MIFCSLVMTVVLVNAEAGRYAPQPLRAQPRLMPQPNDTVCQIKSKLLHLILYRMSSARFVGPMLEKANNQGLLQLDTAFCRLYAPLQLVGFAHRKDPCRS